MECGHLDSAISGSKEARESVDSHGRIRPQHGLDNVAQDVQRRLQIVMKGAAVGMSD